MSAVAIRAEIRLPTPQADSAAKAIQELVHDLRQPLSSIEAIAYFVEMTLPPELLQARQQMHRLQELVAQAAAIVDNSSRSVRKPAGSSGASF